MTDTLVSQRSTVKCACYLLYTDLGDGHSLVTWQRCPEHPAPRPTNYERKLEPNSVEVGEDAKGAVYVKSAKVYDEDPLKAGERAVAAFHHARELAQGKKEAP